MKNVSAHSATSPVHWLVNPFTDWKANLVSAIQNGTRALFVCAALIVVLAFALPLAAQAQNNWANPYINSTHLYRVPMGNTANSVTWELFDNLAEAADYTLNGTQSWATADKVGSNAEIEIYFDDAVFTTGQTWYLVYSEWNGTVGSGNCVAKRSVEIKPTTNDFKISLADDDEDCNSYADAGHVWNNTDDLTATRSLEVPFTVTMNKNTNHAVKVWSFDGQITVNGGYSVPTVPADFITMTMGSSDYGTFVISDIGNDGTFKMTVTIADPPVAAYTNADEVEFTVNISGNITVDVGVTLTISNAVARSGTNYTVVTDDTGSAVEHNQTRTLWGIPNTSVISVSAN